MDHVSFQYVYSSVHPSHWKMLLTLVEVGKLDISKCICAVLWVLGEEIDFTSLYYCGMFGKHLFCLPHLSTLVWFGRDL